MLGTVFAYIEDREKNAYSYIPINDRNHINFHQNKMEPIIHLNQTGGGT